jgi:uncharacterized protein YaaN involved in tellurite resistance
MELSYILTVNIYVFAASVALSVFTGCMLLKLYSCVKKNTILLACMIDEHICIVKTLKENQKIIVDIVNRIEAFENRDCAKDEMRDLEVEILYKEIEQLTKG